jgi:ubiquinone/menaquinone biosynthesis C-methylase UbiE
MATDKQAPLVLKQFDSVANGYTGWYEGPSLGAHAFRRRRQLTLDSLAKMKPGKVLDIGCGPGVLIEGLRAQGHEVWGVDVAPAMIDECIQRFGDDSKVHFSTGRIETLDFPDQTFDAITCLGVMEYLDDDRVALREMNRVLKPGGIAVITCPHYWAPWRRWDALYWRMVQPLRSLLGRDPYSLVTHREYRESAFRSMLDGCGFAVIDIAFYGFGLVPTPFDRKFPGLHASLGLAVDRRARGLWRKLGMGFNIVVTKSDAFRR